MLFDVHSQLTHGWLTVCTSKIGWRKALPSNSLWNHRFGRKNERDIRNITLKSSSFLGFQHNLQHLRMKWSSFCYHWNDSREGQKKNWWLGGTWYLSISGFKMLQRGLGFESIPQLVVGGWSTLKSRPYGGHLTSGWILRRLMKPSCWMVNPHGNSLKFCNSHALMLHHYHSLSCYPLDVAIYGIKHRVGDRSQHIPVIIPLYPVIMC